MHQDKKVGLALALLVIGFVGAFCLRQDQNTAVKIPELNDPHYLDQQIANKDRTPYLGTQENGALSTQFGGEQGSVDVEDVETEQEFTSGSKISAPTISHQTSVTNKKIKRSNADRWGEMPEFLKEIELSDEQFTNSDLSDTGFESNQDRSEFQSVSPDSIPNQVLSKSENVKPEHNNAWEVNPSKRSTESGKSTQTRSSQIRIHTVKPGETLSEIAIRYLGTSRKYQEIFKLNRDQLRSPNDIREGMKLRIPVYQTPNSVPQSANRQSSTGTSALGGKRTVGQMVSQPVLKSDSSTIQFEGQIESFPNSQNQKKGARSIRENYRKFIPIPRSPLSSQNKRTNTRSSLSQVQPQNMESFEGNSQKTNQSQGRLKANTYVIKPGDSLESIAVRLYGKRSAAFKIYQKNRDTLKNADYIRPGMVLQLP